MHHKTYPSEPFGLPGQVITFYSYKGGTGRSMALANIACLLAGDKRILSDKGVLMIDWDIEAPGLHRYFRDQFQKQFGDTKDTEKSVDEHLGLIDLFAELNSQIPETDDPYKGQTEEQARKILEETDFDRFILKTDISSLYLLKAGKFNDDYSQSVSTFDWESLYIRSPRLMRLFAEILAERFQFVLIDSRTGITDISNICTMLMPEKLVVVFTPNYQSLTGIKHLVEQAIEYREQSNDNRLLSVFPLPSRIDISMPKLENIWRRGSSEKRIPGYQPLFEELFIQAYNLKQCDLEFYFDEVKIQHVADYSYGEGIAAIIEDSGERLSLARSYSNFTEYLLRETPDTPKAFRETPDTPKAFDAYISYDSRDKASVKKLVQMLKERGISAWLDEEQVLPGYSWEEETKQAIQNVKVIIICIGNHGISPRQEVETKAAIRRMREASQRIPVIPVFLPGAKPDQLPPVLREVRSVEFEGTDPDDALEDIIWGITGIKHRDKAEV